MLPVALVVSGCGDTVSLDPVAKAADVTSKQSSEHVTITSTVTSGTQVITMVGEGDFRNDGNVGVLTVRSTSGAMTGTDVQTVVQGTRIYLTSSALRGHLPGGKAWLSFDVAKEAKAIGVGLPASVASQSPADMLARLKTTADVSVAGHGKVDGVATTHYSAILDPDRAAKLSKALGVTISYAPLDVWVDRAGLVRRIHLAYVQSGSSVLPASSLESTMTFSRYGEPVKVSAPPAFATYDATDDALAHLKK